MRIAFKSITRYQSGSVLVESIIVMPIFLIMVFGMMEMTFVFKAKNTLNLATQEAVRKGSFSNAKIDPMHKALEKGMAPLYSLKDTCGTTGTAGSAIGINPGEACSKLIRAAIDKQVKGQGAAGAITIISPSKAMVEKGSGFGVEMKIDSNGNYGKGDGKRIAIPNDNLNWRSTGTKTFTVGGQSIELNIQDANLLKIKTFWCQKLSVPGLDRLFYNTILRFNQSPEQHYCNQLSLVTATGIAKTVFGKEQGYFMAIRSHAIARMQSPIFGDSLLSSSALAKATDSTTPVSTTPSAPVDSTAGTGTCDPNTDPYCTSNPNGGGNGPKDSHGCNADEIFKKIQIIDGTNREVNGGYCTKSDLDCSKEKNKNHKDCCAQITTSLLKAFNQYAKNSHTIESLQRKLASQQLRFDYNRLNKPKRLI